MAERWQLKPEALGSTPGGATFLSCPMPFQRSTDSDGPDCVFQLDTIGLRTMEESRPSDSSPCCDYACDLSYIVINVHKTHLSKCQAQISTSLSTLSITCTHACMHAHTCSLLQLHSCVFHAHTLKHAPNHTCISIFSIHYSLLIGHLPLPW